MRRVVCVPEASAWDVAKATSLSEIFSIFAKHEMLNVANQAMQAKQRQGNDIRERDSVVIMVSLF